MNCFYDEYMFENPICNHLRCPFMDRIANTLLPDMPKADKLFTRAHYRNELKPQIAEEFYKKYVDKLEWDYADIGCFSAILRLEELPKILQVDANFAMALRPLFEKDGFRVCPEYDEGKKIGYRITWR